MEWSADVFREIAEWLDTKTCLTLQSTCTEASCALSPAYFRLRLSDYRRTRSPRPRGSVPFTVDVSAPVWARASMIIEAGRHWGRWDDVIGLRRRLGRRDIVIGDDDANDEESLRSFRELPSSLAQLSFLGPHVGLGLTVDTGGHSLLSRSLTVRFEEPLRCEAALDVSNGAEDPLVSSCSVYGQSTNTSGRETHLTFSTLALWLYLRSYCKAASYVMQVRGDIEALLHHLAHMRSKATNSDKRAAPSSSSSGMFDVSPTSSASRGSSPSPTPTPSPAGEEDDESPTASSPPPGRRPEDSSGPPIGPKRPHLHTVDVSSFLLLSDWSSTSSKDGGKVWLFGNGWHFRSNVPKMLLTFSCWPHDDGVVRAFADSIKAVGGVDSVEGPYLVHRQ
ncbi:unnamed protein product [Vitrella brassicaformis CCMP3155]|uniref:Uncharacterized protein n=1 Tax=Vitrella brassicaformis (strain CCMP3155) TaxID=1169540 RepID=A0A0G4G4G9_VITBC|nr:unnamed protein product [Vitrella brassicaformis CCMP3155]|eukprot:CEM22836.1 unnamed protein product [Vitrella brassicaformis CCMP3155]